MQSSVDGGRRRLVAAAAAAALLPAVSLRARADDRWPAWNGMMADSLTSDGRLIDHSQDDLRTTSEGQAYALFFALVHNDQAQFDRILAWTVNNLAAGDMRYQLPAWLWGRQKDAWAVIDANPAADSDLWLAYTLLEASRLWHRPVLQEIAHGMLAQIRQREVFQRPGGPTLLLPGPSGFVEDEVVRVNPSYLPLPLLRRFAAVDSAGPWLAMIDGVMALMAQTTPRGYAPDWACWHSGAFHEDPEKGAVGSYDAIRCYLWAGMLSPRDPLFRMQLAYLQGPRGRLKRGQPLWEWVNTRSGEGGGEAGYGFRAAVLPYLAIQGESALAAQLQRSLPTAAEQQAAGPAYYARMLSLFGNGWYEGRYRFGHQGQLQPRWR